MFKRNQLLIFAGRIMAIFMGVICSFSSVSMAADKVLASGMEIPMLPISILNHSVNKKGNADARATRNTPVLNDDTHTHLQRPDAVEGGKTKQNAGPVIKFEAKMVARVTPGVNEIIKISKGYLNRIITPFQKAVVETTSKAQMKLTGSSIYINTASDRPITMFIHQKGEPDPAVSLTLLPRAIPPRQVKILLGQEGALPVIKPGKWEKTHPFISGIKKSMQDIAKGQIPHGYGFRKYKIDSDPMVDCFGNNQAITIDSEQVMVGHAVTYIVSSVENISNGEIELNESACYKQGVLAVAFWPAVRLKPGQRSEMYIAIKNRDAKKIRNRPSLLSNGDL